MHTIQGSCLCGQVSYQVTKSDGIFQYCHCSRCRKFTGSAFASNLLVQPHEFCWLTGEQLVNRYEPEHTKYFASCFCQVCGSSLPWKNKTGTIIVVPAGSLDEPPLAQVQHNIFYESRAAWFAEPATLPQHPTLPGKR